MSHFSVAVITKAHGNVENALAPFHEYETTGIKDEYVVSSSTLEDLVTRYKSLSMNLMKNTNHKLNPEDPLYRLCEDSLFIRDPMEGEVLELRSLNAIKNPQDYEGREVIKIKNEDGTYTHKILDLGMFNHWEKVVASPMNVFSLTEFACWVYDAELPSVVSGEEPSSEWDIWIELNTKGELVDFFTSTNPNAQWDDYEIGGRWSNMLKTVNGESVNSCELGVLDFEFEVTQLKADANSLYDLFETHFGDLTKDWKPWQAVLADQSFSSMEERRNFYNNQEQIKIIRNASEVFIYEIDGFLADRASFVTDSSCNPFGTFAVLDATKDHEIGRWLDSDHVEFNWAEQNQQLLKSFPQNYIITIVDCHI